MCQTDKQTTSLSSKPPQAISFFRTENIPGTFGVNSNITWTFDGTTDLSQVTGYDMQLSKSSEFLGTVREIFNIPSNDRSWVVNATATPLWNEQIYVRMRSIGKLRLKGVWSKITERWWTGSDCSDSQYLNDESNNPILWQCVDCPIGADCTAKSTFLGVKAEFGYYRLKEHQIGQVLSNSNINTTTAITTSTATIFVKCLYPGACLGGKNRALKGRYLSFDTKTDYSLLDSPESCNEELGFRNGSRLCHGCTRNWRRFSRDECRKCSDETSNWLFMVLGFLFILGALVWFVRSSIKEAGKTTVSESVQKIIINYLQVAALFGAFPLRWPNAISTLFQIQGSFSTLGEHLLNPDCVAYVSQNSEAQLHYGKQLGYLILPWFMVLSAFFVWKGLAHKNSRDFSKRAPATKMMNEALTPSLDSGAVSLSSDTATDDIVLTTNSGTRVTVSGMLNELTYKDKWVSSFFFFFHQHIIVLSLPPQINYNATKFTHFFFCRLFLSAC
tara:strand:- start:57 stop:1559 length:1503 start_codon:yes stop_codon:yes gene_type:complete